MKRKLTLTTAFIFLLMLMLTLGGCADFAFNPVGRWTVSEERLYADGVLKSTTEAKDFAFGGDTALVFGKTGTGYIDSGTKNNVSFTYEYTDNDITLHREGINGSPEITIVYTVEENGSAIVVTSEEYDDTENGKTVHYKRDMVFRR